VGASSSLTCACSGDPFIRSTQIGARELSGRCACLVFLGLRFDFGKVQLVAIGILEVCRPDSIVVNDRIPKFDSLFLQRRHHFLDGFR